MPLSISSKNDTLYYKSPDGEIGKIFPESETIFFGTSKEIGDFQAKFYKNGEGAITHCMVHVGFGGWRFDKIR